MKVFFDAEHASNSDLLPGNSKHSGKYIKYGFIKAFFCNLGKKNPFLNMLLKVYFIHTCMAKNSLCLRILVSLHYNTIGQPLSDSDATRGTNITKLQHHGYQAEEQQMGETVTVSYSTSTISFSRLCSLHHVKCSLHWRFH